jgi:hypothetical protein
MSSQPGISSVQVSLLAERAIVTYLASSHWTPSSIAEEIDDIGFEAEVVERGGDDEIVLRVYGIADEVEQNVGRRGTMWSGLSKGTGSDNTSGRRGSAWSAVGNMLAITPSRSNRTPTSAPLPINEHEPEDLTNALAAILGVTRVAFPPPYTEISFTHSPNLMTLRLIIDSLALSFPRLTFLPTSTMSQANSQLASLQKLHETAKWRRTFWTAFYFAVPVFVVSMGPMWLPSWLMGWTMKTFFGINGLFWGDVIALALTIPVQGWLARGFYSNAYKSLTHGSATMCVLI